MLRAGSAEVRARRLTTSCYRVDFTWSWAIEFLFLYTLLSGERVYTLLSGVEITYVYSGIYLNNFYLKNATLAYL